MNELKKLIEQIAKAVSDGTAKKKRSGNDPGGYQETEEQKQLCKKLQTLTAIKNANLNLDDVREAVKEIGPATPAVKKSTKGGK